METIRHHRRTHVVLGIAKIVLQAATLATAIMAVHELDRIHHRIKKIERADKDRKHRLL